MSDDITPATPALQAIDHIDQGICRCTNFMEGVDLGGPMWVMLDAVRADLLAAMRSLTWTPSEN